MKFLTKKSNSDILANNLVYKKNNSRNNKKLHEKLVKEQKQFCAYTEKYIQELDSSEVEHFNSSIKYNDNYYNYYAVIREANLYKKDEAYENAIFFKSLFFQDEKKLTKRIRFVENIYIVVDENDYEAKDLIDFLGFNHPNLYKQRLRHIKRLKKNFADANYSKKQYVEYFKEHNEDLSFITAIENEFNLKLEDIISTK